MKEKDPLTLTLSFSCSFLIKQGLNRHLWHGPPLVWCYLSVLPFFVWFESLKRLFEVVWMNVIYSENGVIRNGNPLNRRANWGESNWENFYFFNSPHLDTGWLLQRWLFQHIYIWAGLKTLHKVNMEMNIWGPCNIFLVSLFYQ